MIEINLIKKQDMDTLVYKKMPWDVTVGKIPYQVIKVEGHAHTIGGKLDWGEGNCFWAYPYGEEMSFDNLIEFDGEPGARWGIEYYPTNYIKCKYDETEIRKGRHLIITRNEEPFYEGFMTFHEALSYILDNRLDDHPMDLNNRDFDKNVIGRKVWWRSEPGVITHYCKGQAAVIIKPDGIERFTEPREFADDDWPIEEDIEIKADIFSDHIWWYRK
jgi:hypothetical protein